MTVNLSKDTEDLIQSVMQSGRFASPEEAIAEAMRLLQRETSRRPAIPQESAPDPVLGCMQDDAELMDEIVADAYRHRREESWRELEL